MNAQHRNRRRLVAVVGVLTAATLVVGITWFSRSADPATDELRGLLLSASDYPYPVANEPSVETMYPDAAYRGSTAVLAGMTPASSRCRDRRENLSRTERDSITGRVSSTTTPSLADNAMTISITLSRGLPHDYVPRLATLFATSCRSFAIKANEGAPVNVTTALLRPIPRWLADPRYSPSLVLQQTTRESDSGPNTPPWFTLTARGSVDGTDVTVNLISPNGEPPAAQQDQAFEVLRRQLAEIADR